MVSSVDEELGWTQPLEGVEEEGDFGGPGAAVNKVAVEEVIVVGCWETVQSEELHQIKELPCRPAVSIVVLSHAQILGLPTVSITADGQLGIIWNFHLHHCGFLIDNLLDSNDDLVDIFLMQLLPILKPVQHIRNELFCHFAS